MHKTFRQISTLLLIFGSLLMIDSCKYDPRKGFNWDTNLVAPIGYSEVSILDFLPDSLVQTAGDNFMSIVFRDTLLQTDVADFITVPDTEIQQGLSLRTLELPRDTITRRVSLGFIANQLIAQGGQNATIGLTIINNNGNVTTLPPIANVSSDNIDIDASQFFEYADLSAGFIDLQILNRLPVDLYNVGFTLRNKNLGNIVLSDTFPSIPSLESVDATYPMAGKSIESALVGKMTTLSTLGGFVLMDTSDYIEIRLIARGLKATHATAVFPNQTVIDSIAKVKYYFGDKLKDVQLTKIAVKYGKLKIRAFSTVEDTILFKYELTSAYYKDGTHPFIIGKLPPAVNGVPSIVEDTNIIRDAYIDLTVNGTTYNTSQQRIKIDFLSSGKVIDFDLADSVYAYFGLLEIEPSYVEGYIGRDTAIFKGEEKIEVFDQWKTQLDHITAKDPRFTFSFANTIGANARIDVNKIKFTNSKTGATKLLDAPWISTTGNFIAINGPTLADTSEEVITSLAQLNASNSNIAEIIAILPDKMEYDMRIIANYDKDSTSHDNFGTDRSSIKVMLDAELPLEGAIDNLVLRDSVPLNFAASLSGKVENVNEGTLKIMLRNEFPVQITAWASIVDENYVEVAALTPNEGFVMAAGSVSANGVVEQAMESIYLKTLEQADIQNVLARGKHLVMRYRADTKPSNTPVKFYANYRIKAKMVADFEYGVHL